METTECLPLRTSRLLLRDFVRADIQDVHAIRRDPDVARFMDDLVPETLSQSQLWLNRVIVHNQERPRSGYNLAIVHVADQRVIGWVGMGRSSRYPDQQTLGFGYALHRAYWGYGYATEAVTAALALGVQIFAVSRVSAWCYAANEASRRVLERAGLGLIRCYDHVEPKTGRCVQCVEYAARMDNGSTRA